MTTIEEWIEFFEGAGSIHLVVELGEEPQRYIDLKNKIPISPETLSNRLHTGVKIEVWELDLIEKDGTDARVYRLTEKGESAFDRLTEVGAVEASHRVREYSTELERAKQAFLEILTSDN